MPIHLAISLLIIYDKGIITYVYKDLTIAVFFATLNKSIGKKAGKSNCPMTRNYIN